MMIPVDNLSKKLMQEYTKAPDSLSLPINSAVFANAVTKMIDMLIPFKITAPYTECLVSLSIANNQMLPKTMHNAPMIYVS